MAAAASKAPSTAPANPLEDALEKITGKSLLSKSAGTAQPLGYENQGFRTSGRDIVSIKGGDAESTGMTPAQKLEYELAQKKHEQELTAFKYAQEQDVLSNLLRQQESERATAENLRQAEELGLTKQRTAQDLATAQLAMRTNEQAMEAERQRMGLAASEATRAAEKFALDKQAAAQAAVYMAAEEKRKAQADALKYGLYGSYENAMRSARFEAERRGANPYGMSRANMGWSPIGTTADTAYLISKGIQPSVGALMNYKTYAGVVPGVGYNAQFATTQPGEHFFDKYSGMWVRPPLPSGGTMPTWQRIPGRV